MSASGDDQAFEASKNLTFLAATTFAALFIMVAIFAMINGSTSGGPFANTVLAYLFGGNLLGLDSAVRVLILMGGLLALSWAVELWAGLDDGRDVSIGAPFWIGLALIGLFLIQYVLPPVVLETLGVLAVVEYLTGVPLAEINVPQTAVIGIIFMSIFWIVKARLVAAIPQVKGSAASSASGLAYQVGEGFIDLARTYRKILVKLAAAAGVVFGLVITGLAEAGGEFIGEIGGRTVGLLFQSPGWGGYIASGMGYYLNNFVEWVPVSLTPTEFAVFLTMVLIFSIGAAYSTRVSN